ncbi:hypothetical protein [Mesorhizobium sp.]|nr:hypothetical protein [Mesorhizobium sp.]
MPDEHAFRMNAERQAAIGGMAVELRQAFARKLELRRAADADGAAPT